jgi:hypothetical protein
MTHLGNDPGVVTAGGKHVGYLRVGEQVVSCVDRHGATGSCTVPTAKIGKRMSDSATGAAARREAARQAIVEKKATQILATHAIGLPPFERKCGQLSIDLNQLHSKDGRYQSIMSTRDIVQKCNEAMRLGVDFPTLWHTIIKPDPSVIGPPVQRLHGNRTYLEIPLLRGDWLVIDNEARAVGVR